LPIEERMIRSIPLCAPGAAAVLARREDAEEVSVTCTSPRTLDRAP
jgi:hypothetical protein